MTHEHLSLLNSFIRAGMNLRGSILETQVRAAHIFQTMLSFGRHHAPPLFQRFWAGPIRLLKPVRRCAYALCQAWTVGTASMPGIKGARSLGTRARLAWQNREQLLSLTWRGVRARRFIEFARAHVSRSSSVFEAAEELGMSLRRLYFLTDQEFGCPPGILLDLARMTSVARSIRAGDSSVAHIAREHGFRNRAALHHQFVRFVGITPGSYRDQAPRAPHRAPEK